MLKELKFVKGAVARKDLIPGMTHFRIENGTVRSYNGTLALSSPIPFNIDCCPKAEQLIAAIESCEETITLSMTGAARLRIQSGSFRAFVETIDGPTHHVEPAGQHIDIDSEVLLHAMKLLDPFMGTDASRPWSTGILFKGQSAFATNNTCVVEYWLGKPVPFFAGIPRECVKEIVRVNEPPTHCQLDASSITFHFSDGRWIRSQLLDTGWPDLERILDKPHNAVPINPLLFKGIDSLTKLKDGASRIYIKDGMLRTSTEEQTGGEYEVPGLPFEGCYRIQMLALLEGVVTHADFTLYPEPALFFGERLRGAIVGMMM